MKASDLLITEYELHVFYESDYEHDVVTLRRTSKNPEQWGIYHNPFVLDKKSGRFCYDPLPSTREKKYFENYRFTSAEEAVQFWEKLYASSFFPAEQNRLMYMMRDKMSMGYRTVFRDEKTSQLWIDTPFEFGDGDYFVIRLKKDKKDPKTLVIDDTGHTYMHLSIWYTDDQIMECINSQKFQTIMKENVVTFSNRSGCFKKTTTKTTFTDAVKEYTDTLNKLVEYMRKGVDRGEV